MMRRVLLLATDITFTTGVPVVQVEEDCDFCGFREWSL